MTEMNRPEDDNLGSFYMGRMRNPPEPRRILPKGMLTAVTLFAFAAIIWYAYPQGGEKSAMLTIPTITADKSAYKFKPENPGGMEVPHQDSTVFDPIDSKSAAADAIEKLGAPPEEPVDKDSVLTTAAPKLEKLNLDMQIKEAPNGTEKIVPAIEEKPAPKVDAKVEHKPAPKTEPKVVAKVEAKPVKTEAKPVKTETPKVSPAMTEPAAGEEVESLPLSPEEPSPTLNAEASKNETPAVVEAPKAETPKTETLKTEAPKAAVAEPKPVHVSKPAVAKSTKPARVELMSTTPKAEPKIAPAVKGGIFIQLGSYRDLKVAKAEWVKLQKKFPQTLGKMAMQTSTANLGIKGTFHRVQAKVPSEARAREICHLMKESGNPDCILVR